jgi:hypothetical protein
MFAERKGQVPSCGVIGFWELYCSRERGIFVDSESRTLAGLQVPLCFALWLLDCHSFVGDGEHSFSCMHNEKEES